MESSPSLSLVWSIVSVIDTALAIFSPVEGNADVSSSAGEHAVLEWYSGTLEVILGEVSAVGFAVDAEALGDGDWWDLDHA